jgi:hypothetical protein
LWGDGVFAAAVKEGYHRTWVGYARRTEIRVLFRGSRGREDGPVLGEIRNGETAVRGSGRFKVTQEVTGWATWSCAGVGGKDAAVKTTGKCSRRLARGHVAYPAFGSASSPTI